ncbi:HepT-like ribonuclease domain-containing protein [Phytoactinopolyspora limicola]|uniref:HepT-like ribonuclease domain-containing protein n=1 Tax=Phytoactinopolyspora limicola TaxID=2715536 RepID=UPI001408B203|nr:HepT-like ribonuclease domain-containing protein [Phytoactinopolyspora limicola]
MDIRTAERLLYVDASLAEMGQLAARGRAAYDSDIAVARACQYNVIRLAADLERLGDSWLESHPEVPWRLIRGMRNRVAHNYWTVDDDIVWSVVAEHAPELREALSDEIDTARSVLDADDSVAGSSDNS